MPIDLEIRRFAMPDGILGTQAVVLGVTQDARQKMAETFLRRKETEHITGMGRATIYKRISEGTFPKPVKIGKRSVRWIESEVSEWVRKRIEESRQS